MSAPSRPPSSPDSRPPSSSAPLHPPSSSRGGSRTSRVEVEYCTQCRWLLRGAWVAQELLQTFRDRLGEVALVPGTGGVFRVAVDDGSGAVTIFDRADEGGMPDIVELKRRVRDRIAPDMALGHADRGREDQGRGGES